MIKNLQTQWKVKIKDDWFLPYHDVICDSLAKLWKYYSKIDTKPAFILTLGTVSVGQNWPLGVQKLVSLIRDGKKVQFFWKSSESTRIKNSFRSISTLWWNSEFSKNFALKSGLWTLKGPDVPWWLYISTLVILITTYGATGRARQWQKRLLGFGRYI